VSCGLTLPTGFVHFEDIAKPIEIILPVQTYSLSARKSLFKAVWFLLNLTSYKLIFMVNLYQGRTQI